MLYQTQKLFCRRKPMIISDLNYLEVVTESERVEGGILNFFTNQSNYSGISQGASANAGNGGFLNLANVAVAANVAAPIQVNL
jgi:hypothetical protein